MKKIYAIVLIVAIITLISVVGIAISILMSNSH